MSLSENMVDVADHVIHMSKKHDFSLDEDSVRGAVENSAEALNLELSEADVVAACDHILNQ